MASSWPFTDESASKRHTAEPTLTELYECLSAKVSEMRLLDDIFWDLHEAWDEFPESRTALEERIKRMSDLGRTNDLLADFYREWITHVSRDKIRKLNILDLPDELLAQIFEEAEDRQPCRSGRTRWTRDVDNIRNIRLTCRRFCDASSHLLIRCLHVHLNPQSLHHLETIASHPSLGRQVETIVVRCDFYDGGTAEDIDLFAQWAHRSLEKEFGLRDRQFLDREFYGWGFHAASDQVGWDRDVDFYNDMVGNTVRPRARAEWIVDFIRKDLPVVAHHYELLAEAQKEYKRRHEQQCQLLRDKSWTHRLADAMAKMPRARHLVFTDDSGERPTRWRTWSRSHTDLFNDDDWLKHRFVHPLSCEEIYSLRDDTLSDVPYPLDLTSSILGALGDSNVRLAKLDLNVSLPPLDGPNPDGEECDKIAVAVSELQALQITLTGAGPAPPTMSSRNPALPIRLFELLLTSPRLASLWCKPDHGLVPASWLTWQLCDLLPQVQAPRLRTSSLVGCVFDLGNLQLLVNNISPEIQRLELIRPDLLGPEGKWADAADILRERPEGCELGLTEPTGGELVYGKKVPERTHIVVVLGRMIPVEEFHDALMDYIDRKTAVNPLRGTMAADPAVEPWHYERIEMTRRS